MISTYSNGGFAIDEDVSQTYTATSEIIGNITITPSSLIVADEVDYTITYGLLNILKAGSEIRITIPSELVLASSPSYTYSLNSGASLISSPAISGNLLTFPSIISA